MRQTPDGNGRLELVTFHSPAHEGDHRPAPANAPGIRHIAFAVEDIDAVVGGLRDRGAELVGELERYEDSDRLCARNRARRSVAGWAPRGRLSPAACVASSRST